jgi:hypothetical protein
VEAALVFPILILTVMAIVEFGMAFKDWLTVSHSAREGARAGATYGDDPRADILVLEDVERFLGSAASLEIENVRIYNPDNPSQGTDYSYTPGANCNGAICCDWTPCPDPDLPSPPYVAPNWLPGDRDVSAPDTDRIGVEIVYTHLWFTNFFADETEFTSRVEFQIEPQIFE